MHQSEQFPALLAPTAGPTKIYSNAEDAKIAWPSLAILKPGTEQPMEDINSAEILPEDTYDLADESAQCLVSVFRTFLDFKHAPDALQGRRRALSWDSALCRRQGSDQNEENEDTAVFTFARPLDSRMSPSQPPPSPAALTVHPSERATNLHHQCSSLQSPTGIGAANIGSDLAAPTTLMIRNIACRHTQESITRILDEVGLQRSYDFIHLPMNPTRKANLGYFFVNFIDPQYVGKCRDLLQGKRFGSSASMKRCEVSIAHVQGRENMERHCAQRLQAAHEH